MAVKSWVDSQIVSSMLSFASQRNSQVVSKEIANAEIASKERIKQMEINQSKWEKEQDIRSKEKIAMFQGFIDYRKAKELNKSNQLITAAKILSETEIADLQRSQSFINVDTQGQYSVQSAQITAQGRVDAAEINSEAGKFSTIMNSLTSSANTQSNIQSNEKMKQAELEQRERESKRNVKQRYVDSGLNFVIGASKEARYWWQTIQSKGLSSMLDKVSKDFIDQGL